MEKLLVVENVQSLRDQLKWGLGTEYMILEGADRHQAMELFLSHAPKVVMLDLELPPDPEGTSEGLRCLEWMIESRPATKVVVLAGNDEREMAYQAVSRGAYDFYVKPVELTELTELKIIVDRAFHLSAIEEKTTQLKEALERSSAGIVGIAGQCAAMQQLLAPLQKVIPLGVPEVDGRHLGRESFAVPARGTASSVPEQKLRGQGWLPNENEATAVPANLTLREVRDMVEKGMISSAVGSCGGNMAKASEMLGVSRPALYDLMKKHGLFKPGVRE